MKKRLILTKKIQSRNQKYFFITGVVAFFVAGILLGASFLLNSSMQKQFAGSRHIFQAKEMITNAFYEVQVGDVARGKGGVGSLPPTEGMTYLIVEVTVKNKSNKTLPLYPVSQTYVKDDQGQTFTIGPAMVDRPFLAGDLAPGEVLKGQIAYEIPLTLQHPQFYLEGLTELPVIVQL